MIEPINRRDIPGYFLNKLAEARAIIYEVGEPNLGLQFDIYHRQVEDGDVAVALKEYAGLTRHYQIANPPDRGEPDAGDLNYRLASEADRRERLPGLDRLRVQAPPRHGGGPRLDQGLRCDAGLRLSYRGSSPVSTQPRAPEQAARWIPVTSTGMTSRGKAS